MLLPKGARQALGYLRGKYKVSEPDLISLAKKLQPEPEPEKDWDQIVHEYKVKRKQRQRRV